MAELDTNVLGKLLLIQSALNVLPDERRLADFICRGLSDIPGVEGVGACIKGIIYFDNFLMGKDKNDLCDQCTIYKDGWQATHGSEDKACAWEQYPSTACIELRTPSSQYGFFIFAVNNREEFSLYKPYLEIQANLLSMVLENRIQHEYLAKSKVRLESTVQKRTKELRASAQRLNRVLETLPVGVWFTDKEGKVIYGNPAGKNIWKGARNVNPDDWGVTRAVNKNEKTDEEEMKIECIDGSYKTILNWVVPILDEVGNVEGAVVVHQDVTDKIKYEEARLESQRLLEKSESLYHDLVETSQDLIWQCDLEGRYIYLNHAWEETLGYKIEEMLGRKFTDFQSPSYAEKDQKEFLRLKKGNSVKGYESVHLGKDGRQIHLVFNAKFLTDENGQIAGTRGMAYDITQRKQAAEEKANLESRLIQAYKMEAIGTLAGGIAHDFNNILGVILGYADMTKDEVSLGSTVHSNVNKILEAGYRAKELVQQILAFSRQSEMERVLLHPAIVIKEAIKLIKSSLPTTIEIHQEIDPACGVVLGDPTELHQVLMNLCTNAFHAMEETGGTIEITMRNTELVSEDFPEAPDLDSGTYVMLKVRDTGPGISPEIIDKVFDPYFTTKEVGKGTGMGLAIIHGIVKSCGGITKIESELGKGTTLRVYLPIVEEEVVAEEEGDEASPLGGTERILYIEDEPLLSEMGREMLGRLGYSVTVMKKSFAALETFRSQPDQFDLVITDMTMPGMTGKDLARRMLQIRPDIPIILCTGYSSQIDKNEAQQIGIKGFFLKPIVLNDISQMIREVLGAS